MLRLTPCFIIALSGCPTTDAKADGDSGGDSGGDTSGAVCEEAVAPPCVDEMILDLTLHDDRVAEGGIVNTTDGEDFVSDVDATGGGYNVYEDSAWIYLKFTDKGAEKVEIDDETALEDLSWDMGLRRYILRLNGGDSGPSCVGAATMLGYTYEDLTTIPDGLAYQVDDYYTDDCTFINDSSGLEGSPQVATASWWEYPGCVATTGTPFLIQQQSGRVLKLRVETYYDEGQDICNETGSVHASGGYIQLRWRFMN